MLCRIQRDHEQHGEVLDAGGQVAKPTKRRPVRPLRVIHDQEERLITGEVGERPVQPVERRTHRLRARREPLRGRAPQPQRHLGEPPRPGEQPTALAVRGPQRRGEQAPHDAPGIRLLEFARPAAEHPDALIGCARAREVEQRSLPDARWTLDDDDAPRPGPDRVQPPAQFGELPVSIDEASVGGATQGRVYGCESNRPMSPKRGQLT
jgi:hypothetical protein